MTSKLFGRLAISALYVALSTVAFADFPYTNRLATSSDPYLLQHAHNPVDWYPWGPAAFAKAKAEGKPIFLSIGYSTCFWCHVAEKEIYSNPAIAALMNKWFVNVKVDREQRPDVDRLYIVATEILTQHGAWPNNLFLTPDGKPFYAGSYFPPQDDGDTPGFPKVLAAIHDLWENHRAEKVEPAADDVFAALRQAAAAQAGKAVPVMPDAWLHEAATGLLRSIDQVNGGLGAPAPGPKFPQAPALDLLLAAADIEHDAAARDALAKTLDAMAYGGIHDQIGGGFHRYSTEPSWTIPHFEKMLSDNAQLLALYVRTHAATKAPLLAAVARDTASYLLRDMQAPDGGFYTAQDAAIGGVEGADYLWTRPQIESALGAAATDRFLAVYGIVALPDSGRPGETTPPGGVLRVRVPIADTLKRADATDSAAMLAALAPERAKLLAVRRTRPQPATDTKIVTGLNGLAIGALARGGADLDAPEMTAAAKKAATRIWSAAYDAESGLLRHEIIDGKAEVDGFVEDYAMLGEGFLDLAAASKDAAWQAHAAALADAMLARFAGPDGRLAGGAADNLPLTLGDDADTDAPSATSAALDLLSRLAAMPDGARFADAAAKLAVATSGRIAKRPTAWPSAIAALARHPIPEAALAAAAPKAPLAVASAVPGVPGAPSTADHVHVAAVVSGDAVEVTLDVDPGFHINAHHASFDYLVPTDLLLGGLTPSSVDYPKPVRFATTFAKDGLDVYEGKVEIVAHFPAGALSGVMAVDGKVTAQACDAQTCLPPATLPVSAANPGR